MGFFFIKWGVNARGLNDFLKSVEPTKFVNKVY